MVERIEDVLVARDGCTPEEADSITRELAVDLREAIENGDFEEAFNICEMVGLEPDYLEQLL